MKIILANGCFDILHVGHIAHLEEARAMGDQLIVALTADAYVLKGPGRPIYPWAARARVLRALRFVDVVLQTHSATAAIRAMRPDVFVKGIDYAGGDKWAENIEQVCKELDVEIRFTRAPKLSAADTIRRVLAV